METRYHIIKSFKELQQLVKACKKTGYCCFDYETNAEPLYKDTFKPTLLSVTFQPGSGVSIPLQHFEMPQEYQDKTWLEWLMYFGKRVLEDPKIVKLAWNYKFDNQINYKYGIYPQGTAIDGMLCKYILDEEKPNGLKEMVQRYLPEFGGYEKENNLDKLPWDQKPLEPLAKYGCMDTDCTFRLTMFFEHRLMELGMYNILRNLYMPASRVLQEVEANGLLIDRNFNKELLDSYAPKIEQARSNILNLPRVIKFQKKYNQIKIDKYLEQIQDEIDEMDPNDPKNKRKIQTREQKIANIRAGIFTTKKEQDLNREVNVASNTDLPELMYSEMGFGFPILKTSDSGKPSTDEETLTELRLQVKNPESSKAKFLDNLLELRGLEKMYKTYILGWSEKVQDDDCLHGRYLIHGCVTGDTLLVGKEKDIKIQDICPLEEGSKNIESQDLWVLSHEGTWEQVTHTIFKGLLPTYEIITDRGDSLKCTAQHKVLTTHGWKTVKEAYKKKLWLINYDTSKFDITKPSVGKSSREEVFREIPHWPGYLACSDGNIYSIKVPGAQGLLDYNHPHKLIPRDWGNRGRLRVYFRSKERDRKKYAFSVAHLIWMAFNNQSSIPEGKVIDHIDCNPYNNIPENLQCITYRENTLRSYLTTRNSFRQGANNGSNKFGTLQVGKLKEDSLKGFTQRELCNKYKISQKQVSGILSGTRRKDIYLTQITEMAYIGYQPIYDLSIRGFHSYITRSNFINSNTTSGRLSSAEPNLQQVPKTSVDPNIKKQLVAKPGTLYFVMDFSQAELRIMAHLSGDETYLKAFREGQDPHLAIAAKKYGVSYEEAKIALDNEEHADHKLWKTRRKQAKQIAFGIIYGIQAKLLSQKLSDPKAGLIVTPQEAQKSLDEFFEEHPKIKSFMKKQEKLLRKQGYIKSLFGTKRRLPQIYSEDNAEAAYAVRLAVNFPCQSAASHMTLFGSILNYWRMKQGKFPTMEEVATVHDAVYFNAHPEDININTIYEMWNTFRNPETKRYFGFQIDDVDMSMDFEIGRTMAEELPFIPGYDYRKLLEPDFDVESYMKEYKQYQGQDIKDYPKLFPQYFKKDEKQKNKGSIR